MACIVMACIVMAYIVMVCMVRSVPDVFFLKVPPGLAGWAKRGFGGLSVENSESRLECRIPQHNPRANVVSGLNYARGTMDLRALTESVGRCDVPFFLAGNVAVWSNLGVSKAKFTDL